MNEVNLSTFFTQGFFATPQVPQNTRWIASAPQMKILTISNCPLDETLGSGYSVVYYSRGLRERGHETHVFGPNSYEPLRSIRYGSGFRRALGMLWLSLIRLARMRYDVVEFYGAESWLALWVLSHIPRRSFLLVHHSNGLETHLHETVDRFLGPTNMDGTPRRWYQPNMSTLFTFSFTCPDAVVMLSQYDADYARAKRYQTDDRLLYIESPLPTDLLGAQVNFDRDPVVGFCGSWVPRKGSETLRLDLTRLLDEFDLLRVKLVGLGPHFSKEAEFPERVSSRVEIVPFVTNKLELQRVYCSMSIAVVPSLYESFGLVTAEAMASGCAVVASRVGFAAHLEHGTEALTCEDPRSPHLYDQVRELLKDDEKRKRIARRGYERVQSLRWDSAVSQLETFYCERLGELKAVNPHYS